MVELKYRGIEISDRKTLHNLHLQLWQEAIWRFVILGCSKASAGRSRTLSVLSISVSGLLRWSSLEAVLPLQGKLFGCRSPSHTDLSLTYPSRKIPNRCTLETREQTIASFIKELEDNLTTQRLTFGGYIAVLGGTVDVSGCKWPR